MAHQDLGAKLLARVRTDLDEICCRRADAAVGRAADDHGDVTKEKVSGGLTSERRSGKR